MIPRFIKKAGKAVLSMDGLMPFAKGIRCIFVYHDISNPGTPHFADEYYSTPVDGFREQINFLRKRFELVSLETLLFDKSLKPSRHYATITFDDGFASVAGPAFKILSGAEIPFTIFINKAAVEFDQGWITNLVIHRKNEAYLRRLFGYLRGSGITFEEFRSDPIRQFNRLATFDAGLRETYLCHRPANTERTYLDADAVRFLKSEGVLVGSHSADHYRLNACTSDELENQIVENRDFISSLVGKDSNHFAIPFGMAEHYNEIVLKKITEGGHRYVYSSNPMPMTSRGQSGQGAIPRFLLDNLTVRDIVFLINRTFFKRISI